MLPQVEDLEKNEVALQVPQHEHQELIKVQ